MKKPVNQELILLVDIPGYNKGTIIYSTRSEWRLLSNDEVFPYPVKDSDMGKFWKVLPPDPGFKPGDWVTATSMSPSRARGIGEKTPLIIVSSNREDNFVTVEHSSGTYKVYKTFIKKTDVYFFYDSKGVIRKEIYLLDTKSGDFRKSIGNYFDSKETALMHTLTVKLR